MPQPGSYTVAGRRTTHNRPCLKIASTQRRFPFSGEQWKRNYFDRDPDNGHKPNLFNPVRDYYHFAGAATKTVWIGGAFTIGMSKQPMKYKLLDLLIGTLITSGSASLTYNILR